MTILTEKICQLFKSDNLYNFFFSFYKKRLQKKTIFFWINKMIKK